jgi:nucleoside-diphosphate-sugar epimerase
MRKLLLTGATGFLGGEVNRALVNSGVHVESMGKSPKNLFQVDLSDNVPQIKTKYNQVIHCAGKAHSIPRNIEESKMFYKVNLDGTKNLCLSFEKTNIFPEQFVFISTVSVYGKETGENISEEYPLAGNSPYALSKIAAEEFLLNWGKTNGVKIFILRLPLIVGNNPPGNLGKIIKRIKNGSYFSIGKGIARKSVVLAEDVAKLIVAKPEAEGIFNLTDGFNPTFSEIENLIMNKLGKRRILNLPEWFAKLLGKIGDIVPFFPINSGTINKILKNLTFSDQKARLMLDWQPKSVTENWKVI